MFNLPPPSVVVGGGFRVQGLHQHPTVVWVVGLFRVYMCIDMKGFRVEGQQLGAAQSETMAHPGECRHFGHAAKLHSFKSHNTHEDPGFRGPIPVPVGTFKTKVTTLTRISGVYHRGIP